ncbi:MAG: hypothetical protein WAW37_16695 [Syntrophobacteraceae bacterium]
MKRDLCSVMRWFVLLCAMMILTGPAAPFCAEASTVLSGCPVFPADNVWNTPIDTMPVDERSSEYVATIGAAVGLHPDFGSGTWDGGPIGIPYNVVPGSQPKAPITFDYATQSDPGPYPIPPNPKIEGGSQSHGDRHVLVVDRDNCLLYETWSTYPQSGGRWHAGSGAVFDLRSNVLRPADWTSSDAAGLPVLAGLVRYNEVAAGEITHALRFTAPQTRRAYVWPARHYASDLTGLDYPPMGQRFRLKADFDISGFSPQVRVILSALKKYGMILADNGSAWYISGAPDSRWDNDVLVGELSGVKGSDFEAVDASSLMVSPDSGQARTGGPTPRANPPERAVRLIFIHHSTGEQWLADDHGGLGLALRSNRYFVSDTNYDWGPDSIGGNTDIGNWWNWFRGPDHDAYLSALYAETEQHSGYSRLATNPGGPNQIVMFKSCFPNSALTGNPGDPVPPIASNPLRGESAGSESHTVANAKGIYIDLLNYFKTQRDKLFIVIAAPPLIDPARSSNARAFNQWLAHDWLKNYAYKNVFVFDFYNVLTTNGGSPNTNDLNQMAGNHHRWWNGAVEHKIYGDNDANPNVLEYPTGDDDHPSRAGSKKATAEFIKLLNVAYNRWRPSLAEALDNSALAWTSGGNAKWFGETATCFYQGNAAQSGVLADGQFSWLRTTVTGPGTLKFYWRAASQKDHDVLGFSVDGSLKENISGSTGWRQKTCVLGPGAHTLEWRYRKDAGGSVGTDAAWVDKVEWTSP